MFKLGNSIKEAQMLSSSPALRKKFWARKFCLEIRLCAVMFSTLGR